MKYLRILGFCLLGILAAQNVLAAKVYTWKDSKGVVHYGEHPPKDVKATLVKTRTGHSDPTPAPVAAPTTPTATPANQTAAATNELDSLKDPTRCAQARENLNILNTVARIKTQDGNGNSVIMTEDDKAEQRKVAQSIIDQACE
ncbi:MAG: DUF4124 domain-containing protein [Cellvibrio sp.]|uniref:DUF4124 domain-containing protein n=1 Tax=Cellvibrio sp. TaxID=1965322 RepID=UPI0031AC3F48